jgi:signal transduction histidine kinase
MSFLQRFGAQPRWILLFELWGMLLLLGVADVLTRWELSLFVFYAVPIFAAAWYVNRNTALGLAVGGAVVWFWANSHDHPYASDLAYVWAAFNRLIYFLFVAIGGVALAAQNEALRLRLEALERAAHLERELIRVSEHEQRRIGQDLHDGHCQTLAAIGFAAASLTEDLEGCARTEAVAAAEISRMIKEAISEARGLARGLFPVQMNEAGLPVALDELVTTMQRLRHIPVTFEVRGDIRVVDPRVGMHLYRIAQEALNNAVTHANATQVTLSLSQDDEELRLTVRDDGVGFSTDPIVGQGLGMNTMKYRASEIGGSLDIYCDSTRGAVVSCSLPITALDSVNPDYASRS